MDRLRTALTHALLAFVFVYLAGGYM